MLNLIKVELEKKIKTISKVFYIASLLFMILVVIRLVIRIIAVDFALPCTVGLRHYVSQRVKVEAMSNVFTMLGIVNFSLSYIIFGLLFVSMSYCFYDVINLFY